MRGLIFDFFFWMFASTLMVQYDSYCIIKTLVIIIFLIYCGLLIYVRIYVWSATVGTYFRILICGSAIHQHHQASNFNSLLFAIYVRDTSAQAIKKLFNDFIFVKTTHDLWVITLRVHLTILKRTWFWNEGHFHIQMNFSLNRCFKIVYNISRMWSIVSKVFIDC